MMSDNGSITTSKSHFTEDNETTICGTALPFSTAYDIHGTGGTTVTCKRCKKKADKMPVVDDSEWN
jgi:hypothetical protein